MADLNSSVYDFVYFLGGLMVFLWLMHQLFLLKSLHSLSRSVRSSSLVLLHEILAVTQRITSDAVLSILSKKKTVYEYEVEPLSVPSCILSSHLSTSSSSLPSSDIDLTVDLCTRLPCRVDLYVGVQRRLLSFMYNDFLHFSQRPAAGNGGDKLKFGKQISPSQAERPFSFLGHEEAEWHSAQVQMEATESTEIHFRVPKSLVERVNEDPSFFPFVILLTPLSSFSRPPVFNPLVSTSPPLVPLDGVEMVVLPSSSPSTSSARAQWLASHPHPPSSSLLTLCVLSCPPSSDSSSVSLDSTFIISPSPPFILHSDEIFGLNDEPDCLVCLSEPKSVVILPCRHLCVCEACMASFQQQKCPVCRSRLEDYCVLEKKASSGKAEEEAKRMKED